MIFVVSMNSKKSGLSAKRYSIIPLAIISVSIIWYFATTDFATHSDVFWYGVIAGFLALLLLMCLGLIGFLAYQLMKR
jgi:hypothetical protein